MGVYGSPELGHFSNIEQKPKPKNNFPGTLLLLLIAGFLTITVTKYIKSDNYEKNIYKQKSNITDIKHSTFSKPVTNTKGLVPNKTALYLKEDSKLNHELINCIDKMLNDSNNENMNIIQTQTSISKIKEEIENLKKQNIDKDYNSYKSMTTELYTATITLLENYLVNNTDLYFNLINLRNVYVDESSKTYDELITLFNKNDIIYKETENENGSRHIEYNYMSH